MQVEFLKTETAPPSAGGNTLEVFLFEIHGAFNRPV